MLILFIGFELLTNYTFSNQYDSAYAMIKLYLFYFYC